MSDPKGSYLFELAEKVNEIAEKAAEELKEGVDRLDKQVTRLRNAQLNLEELKKDK